MANSDTPSVTAVTAVTTVRPPITCDAHIDIPWIMTKIGRFALNKNNNCRFSEVDLPRMKLGGLQSAVFALYLSDLLQDQIGKNETLNYICRQVAFLENQLGMTIVDDPEVALDSHSVGLVPIFLGLEGGRLLQNDIMNIEKYRRLGVRYLTVTHNRTTEWADSATDLPKHNGLTQFGKNFVREANRQGILIDVSHGSEQTAWQCINESSLPPIASHSACKELRDHPRNLSDDLLKAIAKKKGIVCVPFAKRFVGPSWRSVADHVDHAVQTIGSADFVGIGSDFDGAELAHGINDVEDWKKVVLDELADHGFSGKVIAGIAGGNLLRVLREGL